MEMERTMQQMLQQPLANQEKAETNRKADLENLKRTMEGITSANQAKTKAKLQELTDIIEKKKNADGFTDSRSVPRRANEEAPRRPSKNL
jgi:type I restriction-modification system DNA methylase subunit